MHLFPAAGIDRRNFLRAAAALGAGAAFTPAWAGESMRRGAWPSALPSGATARSCIVVHLAGGVAQTDAWDPKEYTPLRRGMPLRALGSTCRSIATAAPGVRIAEGLDEIASVMDRGCVVRTIVGDGRTTTHAAAPDLLGAIRSMSAGRGNAGLRHGVARSRAMATVPLRGMSDALRLAGEGPCWCRVEHFFQPFGGFDTHDHGAQRMARLRREIDGPIAALVRGLEARGVLDRTLVVVTSEFGRTVGPARHQMTHLAPRLAPQRALAAGRPQPDQAFEAAMADWIERATIDDESTYGFHAHFSRCSAALLFGGGVRRGIAWGRTADVHPMVAVEDAVPWASWCATIAALVGVEAGPGGGQIVQGLLEPACRSR